MRTSNNMADSFNFRSIVYFVLWLDSFYPEFFTDHSERANTLSSAAFFELFSSEIIFVCLISCRGIIICYSARWNRIRVTGPNGVLSLLFSLHLVIVIAIFFLCYIVVIILERSQTLSVERQTYPVNKYIIKLRLSRFKHFQDNRAKKMLSDKPISLNSPKD